MSCRNSGYLRAMKLSVGVLYLVSQMVDAKDSISSSNSLPPLMEEVIVTANKREQSLQDTAMAISALSSEAIKKRGLVGMDDFLRTLPSVNMQDRGAGQNSILIRGLGVDPQVESSTVGVYFGEIPLAGLGGAGTNGQNGSADIKFVDIERIEVLRGPQGTLYGSGSMGGTVRVIPMDPDLTNIEGKVATRYSHTGKRGGDNNMVQGILNIPLLEDKLAVRGVSYWFDNSGFIDNVAASQTPGGGFSDSIAASGVARDHSNVGGDEYLGFRLAALWRPLDSLEITITHLQQEIEQFGQPETDLDLSGDYVQARLGVGRGGVDQESLKNDIKITNLLISLNLGWGEVTSSSSWIDYQSISISDMFVVANLFAPVPVFAPAFPDGTAAPYDNTGISDQDNISQELRVASQLEGRFQFVTGFYFEDNEVDAIQTFAWSGSPLENPLAGLNFVNTLSKSTTQQQAVFGELSYEVIDNFTATLGVRYFDYEKDTRAGQSFFASNGTLGDAQTVSETGTNFKANLSYTFNDDILLYGQWAEGFRLGSGLFSPSPDASCDPDGNGVIDELGISRPSQLDSDTSESFELGIKASSANKRLTLNAAIYHISWDGIPVTVIPRPDCSLFLNAGKALSEGVEIEIQSVITEDLFLNASASYGEATLKEANILGDKGDNLPGSADFNMSIGIQYGFMLAQYDSFARIDYSYLSEYYSNFEENGDVSGGFGQLNLKIGVSVDNFDFDLFVNNVTDSNDFTWVESAFAAAAGTRRAYQVRPRTAGLNIAYHF